MGKNTITILRGNDIPLIVACAVRDDAGEVTPINLEEAVVSVSVSSARMGERALSYDVVDENKLQILCSAEVFASVGVYALEIKINNAGANIRFAYKSAVRVVEYAEELENCDTYSVAYLPEQTACGASIIIAQAVGVSVDVNSGGGGGGVTPAQLAEVVNALNAFKIEQTEKNTTYENAIATNKQKSESNASEIATLKTDNATNKGKISTLETTTASHSSAINTINNILGNINTDIPLINHGTTDTTLELSPNVLHTWGEVASLTLTLGNGRDGIVNEYIFQFASGETATMLTLPDFIKWSSEPVISPNKMYQVSIVDGLGLIAEF